MCNAGEHSHTRHLTCENGQPSRHTPALPHFSNLPSKTAHVFPSRRNWCAGLHRHTSPWLSRHALADHALAPCHTQGVEKCESPRLGSATRAALAHAVPSRTTPVRRSGSPHLGLILPPRVGRPCTCAMPHKGSRNSRWANCLRRRPIRNDGRRSHSRWVDPHVSYVQAHHRSDPRAAYTHTAHAACACGWGPGTMRTVPRSPHWPGPVTVAGYSSSSCLPLPVAVPVTVTQRHWSMRPVTGI